MVVPTFQALSSELLLPVGKVEKMSFNCLFNIMLKTLRWQARHFRAVGQRFQPYRQTSFNRQLSVEVKNHITVCIIHRIVHFSSTSTQPISTCSTGKYYDKNVSTWVRNLTTAGCGGEYEDISGTGRDINISTAPINTTMNLYISYLIFLWCGRVRCGIVTRR